MTRKNKLLLSLVLVALLVVCLALAACTKPHTCGHVCTTCDKCTDTTCTDDVCSSKCPVGGNHSSNSGCTKPDCTCGDNCTCTDDNCTCGNSGDDHKCDNQCPSGDGCLTPDCDHDDCDVKCPVGGNHGNADATKYTISFVHYLPTGLTESAIVGDMPSFANTAAGITVTLPADLDMTAPHYHVNGYRTKVLDVTTGDWVNIDEEHPLVALGGTFTMPAANVRIEIVWAVNNVTISFNANGGSGEKASVTMPYTGIFSHFASNFANTFTGPNGANFLGWSTSSNGSVLENGVYLSTIVSDDDTLTLYAIWDSTQVTPPGPDNGQNIADFVGVWSTQLESGNHTITIIAQSGAYDIVGYAVLDGKTFLTIYLIDGTLEACNTDDEYISNYTFELADGTFTLTAYDAADHYEAAYHFTQKSSVPTTAQSTFMGKWKRSATQKVLIAANGNAYYTYQGVQSIDWMIVGDYCVFAYAANNGYDYYYILTKSSDSLTGYFLAPDVTQVAVTLTANGFYTLKVDGEYVEFVNEGSKPTALEDPVAPSGKKFDSWVIEGTDTPFNFNEAMTADASIEAKFVDDVVYQTVTFTGNATYVKSGISGMPSDTYVISEVKLIVAAPTTTAHIKYTLNGTAVEEDVTLSNSTYASYYDGEGTVVYYYNVTGKIGSATFQIAVLEDGRIAICFDDEVVNNPYLTTGGATDPDDDKCTNPDCGCDNCTCGSDCDGTDCGCATEPAKGDYTGDSFSASFSGSKTVTSFTLSSDYSSVTLYFDDGTTLDRTLLDMTGTSYFEGGVKEATAVYRMTDGNSDWYFFCLYNSAPGIVRVYSENYNLLGTFAKDGATVPDPDDDKCTNPDCGCDNCTCGSDCDGTDCGCATFEPTTDTLDDVVGNWEGSIMINGYEYTKIKITKNDIKIYRTEDSTWVDWYLTDYSGAGQYFVVYFQNAGTSRYTGTITLIDGKIVIAMDDSSISDGATFTKAEDDNPGGEVTPLPDDADGTYTNAAGMSDFDDAIYGYGEYSFNKAVLSGNVLNLSVGDAYPEEVNLTWNGNVGTGKFAYGRLNLYTVTVTVTSGQMVVSISVGGTPYTATFTKNAESSDNDITITFAKSSSATGTQEAVTWTKGTDYQLPDCTFSHEGMSFLGWQIGDNKTLRQPGYTVKFDNDVTITAIFGNVYTDVNEEDYDITVRDDGYVSYDGELYTYSIEESYILVDFDIYYLYIELNDADHTYIILDDMYGMSFETTDGQHTLAFDGKGGATLDGHDLTYTVYYDSITWGIILSGGDDNYSIEVKLSDEFEFYIDAKISIEGTVYVFGNPADDGDDHNCNCGNPDCECTDDSCTGDDCNCGNQGGGDTPTYTKIKEFLDCEYGFATYSSTLKNNGVFEYSGSYTAFKVKVEWTGSFYRLSFTVVKTTDGSAVAALQNANLRKTGTFDNVADQNADIGTFDVGASYIDSVVFGQNTQGKRTLTLNLSSKYNQSLSYTNVIWTEI